jgi:hypothetical protein
MMNAEGSRSGTAISYSDFVIASDFEPRISDFISPLHRASSPWSVKSNCSGVTVM